MSGREVRHFLSGIDRSAHRLARRDHALFSTIVYTGVRLSEIARVVWDDLDLRRRVLRFHSVKGGHPATRHVPRRLARILLEYRQILGDEVVPTPSPMFTSTGRKAISPRGVQYRFTFWLRRSGIRRRMSVHALRHTFATLLYRTSGDLLLVSRAPGHRDIRTTQRYVHIDDPWLVRAINQL
jgi:integrase/recombinase XerC